MLFRFFQRRDAEAQRFFGETKHPKTSKICAPLRLCVENQRISLAAIAFLMAFLPGCQRSSEPASPQIVQRAARQQAKEAGENLSSLQGAVMKGGKISGGDAQGRPLWRLAAREIRTAGAIFKGLPKQATVLDGQVTLFQEGKPQSSLQAARMTFFSTPNGVRLEMKNGVRGQTSGSWTGKRGAIKIAAPRADVDVQKRLIAASGGVQMSQGDLKITAQSLRSPTSLQRVEVAGKVRAVSADGQVEAQTAIYDWKNSKLNARTVVAKRENTTLLGQFLEADTRAQSGVLSGNVIARGENGSARAPSVAFNWKRDQITAQKATFSSEDGQGSAANLRTDSKLRVASASGLTLQQNGATLVAASADGFDGLKRLRGRDVRFSRADVKVSAPRADASQSGSGWILVASGGARGQSARGQISAPSVTWNEVQKRVEGSGGVNFVGVGATGRLSAARVVWEEGRNRVSASGNVRLQKDGSTLSGDALNSDAKFQNAVLSGNVRGQRADGSTLQAGTLQKRGERLFASNGAVVRYKTGGELGTVTMRGAKIEATTQNAVATGGVTVSSSTGARARAPRATYNRKTGKITATGGVDFYDPARGLRTRGDTLVADLNLKLAKLTNARGQGNTSLFDGKNLFE